MKENKTSANQIKASRAYDARNNKVTIACKIDNEYKKAIEQHAKSKGYKSINAYLLALIEADML